MRKKSHKAQQDKLYKPPILFKQRLQFFLLAIPIVVVSVSMIWNAANLQAAINRRTEAYVSDVSQQLSRNIDYRLSKIVLDLELVGDSLGQAANLDSQQNQLQSFLDRKAVKLGFSGLTFIYPNGEFYNPGGFPENLCEISGIRASLGGRSGVSFLDEESILYSIPVYRGKEFAGVLAGIRNKENMQALIRANTFSGRSLNCITDRQGQVIISPTNREPFHQLEDILQDTDAPQIVQDRKQMSVNMKMGRNGVLFFTAVDGTPMILSYNSLNTCGWVLMTLVPADIISQQTDVYIRQTFFIVGMILLLFALLLATYVNIFRLHYRELEEIAYVDSITGGRNNAAFQLRCRELLRQSQPNTYTIIQMNVKAFSLINEEYGSEAGNKTLTYIMRALESSISDEEVASRGDADNFSLLLKEHEQEAVQKRMEIIAAKLNGFNVRRAEPYRLTLRQGAYIIDDSTVDVTILQDRAMTAGKTWQDSDEGRCVFYDTYFTKQMQKEHELNDLFEVSLTNGSFRVFLQPKVRMSDGLPGGAEALIRWYYPEKGMISPSDFIPLFERNGKICNLDLFVFEEVCRTLRRWIDNNMDVVPISVNLSRQHFKKGDFLAPFIEIVDRYHIPRNLIEMELTESIFFDENGVERAKGQIRQIREAGFSCSLDDFGAGYSSLGLLMEFDIDSIKLDRSFFVDIVKPKTREIVSSVVELARNLGAPVVAEGIETEQQLEFLNSIGSETVMVQGYIFSRPLPIADFEVWLQKF